MFHVKQSEYPVRLGQVLDLTITGYTSEGQGVARVEGLAVFVSGAIRGETVRLDPQPPPGEARLPRGLQVRRLRLLAHGL